MIPVQEGRCGKANRSPAPGGSGAGVSPGGLVGTGLEAVGVSVAGLDVALVGIGSDVADALEEHGCVHEQFADFRDGVFEAVFKKDVDEIRVVVTFVVSVHG